MTQTHDASPANDAMARIATANQTFLAVASRATAVSAQGMIAAQKRLMDFAARRMMTDLEAAAAMGRCAKPEEAVALAQEFCRRAMTDYAAETAEMMRAAAAAVADRAEPPHH